MKKKLFRNWWLKISSLVLACVLWFVAVRVDDPFETRTFNNIPVTLTNTDLLEKENKVYEVLENTDTVRVTVRAPKSIIDELRATDIVAKADMSKLTEINTIAVDVEVQSADVESVESNPGLVKLNVEDRATKWVRLSKNTVGEVTEGYMIAGSTLDQTQITVSGPKSRVDQVSSATVEFDVTGAMSDLSANVEIKLCDADGRIIEDDTITKNVNYVRMSVTVYALKEVPIEWSVMGVPADGYVARDEVVCEPQTVQIAGYASTLANVNAITIPESRLNVTGATGDMTDVINIREFLPENVRFADSTFNGRVSVTVPIEAIRERNLRIPIANIQLTNIPESVAEEYEIRFPENVTYAEMTVAALEEQLSGISESSLRGRIDLKEWMESQGHIVLEEGTYIVPISVTIPGDVTIQKEASVTLEVVKPEAEE